MSYVFWAALVALGVYEAWALTKEAEQPSISGLTISEKVWAVTLHYPLVPFLFGLLMGHFFFRRQ